MPTDVLTGALHGVAPVLVRHAVVVLLAEVSETDRDPDAFQRAAFEVGAGATDGFEEVDVARAADDLASYQASVARSREAVAGRSLEEACPGEDYTLRWIYLHMIEEYARHNGHADLLRERIDGATGE